jgi:hypothetical protein
MRSQFSISRSALFAAMLILSCGLSARAADTTPADDNSELGLLKQTYHTLKIADHDYNGHRVKAMHSIENACDKLGENIRGDGKGGERQPVSDDQLRQALRNLQKAHTMATVNGQKEVLAEIDKAIDDLGRALGVK